MYGRKLFQHLCAPDERSYITPPGFVYFGGWAVNPDTYSVFTRAGKARMKSYDTYDKYKYLDMYSYDSLYGYNNLNLSTPVVQDSDGLYTVKPMGYVKVHTCRSFSTFEIIENYSGLSDSELKRFCRDLVDLKTYQFGYHSGFDSNQYDGMYGDRNTMFTFEFYACELGLKPITNVPWMK